MILERSDRFKKQFQKLVKKDKRMIGQIEKTLSFLAEYPPPVPSLRMKAIKGVKGIYECSVNMEVRITFEFAGDDIIFLRNIDYHKKALGSP